MREANSQRIVEAIRRHGALTQVEIAATTGLSQATVSTIVKLLLSQGVVDTRTTVRTGRRAQ
ncbi:MAG: winged helix-turn-helix domain-containing protein, partial [Rhizobiales bacterium]|nr:winged helix-turn-helix domain-containing protein [Hyphomicrobiales bacterium]